MLPDKKCKTCGGMGTKTSTTKMWVDCSACNGRGRDIYYAMTLANDALCKKCFGERGRLEEVKTGITCVSCGGSGYTRF